MKLHHLLPALALLAGCSAIEERQSDNTDGAYAQSRNQACLIEAQRNLAFGKHAEALAALQHWYGPIEDPVAFLTLARIHLGLGNPAKAKEALASAAALVPDSAPLQALLARMENPLKYPAEPSAMEATASPASSPKGYVTLE